MHDILPKIFYFIDRFEPKHIIKLDKKIGIIYRNYEEKYDEKKILKIKKFCKRNRKKFYLSNNINAVNKLNLDGVYLPAFNRSLSSLRLNNKKINIIGSAHTYKDVAHKIKQGVQLIFISPLFKVKKSAHFLGIIRFNLMSQKIKIATVALGGLNSKNIKKIKILNCFGLASISFIKNHGKINNKII